jgi:hypothetical protein
MFFCIQKLFLYAADFKLLTDMLLSVGALC